MATFPTIYRRGTVVQQPVVGDMESTMAHDPAIRSQSEGGYVTSRARFTRISRRWTIRYEWMSKYNAVDTTNANSIKSFEDARCAGAEAFTWTNPVDSIAHTVRFLEPIRYTPHANTNFLWWTVEFTLEEI